MKLTKRSGVSPVIATLLLILIAVAAAIVLYAFVTHFIPSLQSGYSSGSSVVQGSAVIAVPGFNTGGVMSIVLYNEGVVPITGMTLTLPSNMVSVSSGTNSYAFTLDGSPISLANEWGHATLVDSTFISTTDGSDIGIDAPYYSFTLTVNYLGGLSSTQLVTVQTSIVLA